MHVTLTGFVLFLHITVALAAFMMAAVLHTALAVMPRLRTVAEMRPWARLVHRLEPLLPASAVLLLGLGAWLVHLENADGVRWSDAWVATSVATLVVIEGLAGALLAPRAKAVVAAVAAAGDGDVPPELRRAAVDPVLWDLAHVATLGFVGVVFLMAAKPSGAWAVGFPVVGALLGLVLSRLQLRALGQPAADGGIPAQRGAEQPSPVQQ